MRIQWDAALVAATARALDRRFAGSRIRAYELDPVGRRFVLYLRDATLVWELHPTRLGMHLLDPSDPPAGARPLPARLTRVWSPPDDRLLVLETRRVRGRPPRGSVILELFPNQENVVVTEGDDATVRVLLRTREGDRAVRRGRPYSFPPPSQRGGVQDDPGSDPWDGIRGLPPAERRGALLRSVAWTSPLVAPALLEDGGDALWRLLRERVTGDAGASPLPAAVVAGRHGPQPYPIPLPDRTLAETEDLLEAFREARERGPDPSVEALLPGALVEALHATVERARNRVARLEEEWAGMEDPERLQGWGDLLLARFRQVPEGEEAVVLEGFDGAPVRIPLDPTLTPDANARRHYDRAARVRRAREEFPERIRGAREAWAVLEALQERARQGDVTREEVEAAIPDAGIRQGGGGDAPSLPYRRFRSSGGMEIRVGRGAARNDDLTFHHSRPDDVWLHARHTAGAHVILRWDGPGSPPPRDLEEAAILAALHSRARTSGSVPVDWTRRKHVRKPRKAPPGAVLPEQVKTVFVAPDEALLERLRDD
ncbi:MAG TPA: NFACT RNA binding domain-containing protein [Longimicrobiales bacterium]|nr:NFACT RNA binding domain-containing protein [Longimicrobiales bacterium]